MRKSYSESALKLGINNTIQIEKTLTFAKGLQFGCSCACWKDNFKPDAVDPLSALDSICVGRYVWNNVTVVKSEFPFCFRLCLNWSESSNSEWESRASWPAIGVESNSIYWGVEPHCKSYTTIKDFDCFCINIVQRLIFPRSLVKANDLKGNRAFSSKDRSVFPLGIEGLVKLYLVVG